MARTKGKLQQKKSWHCSKHFSETLENAGDEPSLLVSLHNIEEFLERKISQTTENGKLSKGCLWMYERGYKSLVHVTER